MRATVAAWTTKKAVEYVDDDPSPCAQVRRLGAARGARAWRNAQRALQSRDPATPQHRLLPRGVVRVPRTTRVR